MKKKLRPVGKTLLDLEKLLFELVQDHELQKGEVLSLVSTWVDIHYPDAVEKYIEGGSPVFYYGHKDGIVK